MCVCVCVCSVRHYNSAGADAPGVYFRESLDDVGKFHRSKLFDLVTASFVLSELSTDTCVLC